MGFSLNTGTPGDWLVVPKRSTMRDPQTPPDSTETEREEAK